MTCFFFINNWISSVCLSSSSADDLFYTALNGSEDVLGIDHQQTLCILKNWTTLHIKMNKLSLV